MKNSDLLKEYAKYNDESKVLSLGNYMQGKIRTKIGILRGLMGFASLFTVAAIAALVSILLMANPIFPLVIVLGATALVGVASMSYLGIKQLQNKREYAKQSRVVKGVLVKNIRERTNKSRYQNRGLDSRNKRSYDYFTRPTVSHIRSSRPLAGRTKRQPQINVSRMQRLQKTRL